MTNLFFPKRSLGAALGAVTLILAGCGAGSANIPDDLPAPKPLSGPGSQKPEDVAKAKGLSAPSTPTKVDRNFDPTRPNP